MISRLRDFKNSGNPIIMQSKRYYTRRNKNNNDLKMYKIHIVNIDHKVTAPNYALDVSIVYHSRHIIYRRNNGKISNGAMLKFNAYVCFKPLIVTFHNFNNARSTRWVNFNLQTPFVTYSIVN